MADLSLLLEAEKRGILPENMKALLNEARQRGLLEGSAPYEKRVWNATDGESPVTNALAGAGKVFVDVARRAGQAVGAVSQEDIDLAKQRDQALMDTTAGKVGNFVGNMAVFSPAMLIPGANTYAGSMAIGAGIGAMQPTGTGDSTITNMALGAAGGAAGKAVGDKVIIPALTKIGTSLKSLFSKSTPTEYSLTGTITLPDGSKTNLEDLARKAVSDMGTNWDDVSEAVQNQVKQEIDNAINAGSKLPPTAAARKAMLETVIPGYKATLGKATRDRVQQMTEQNLANGPGGESLRELQSSNNAAAADAFDALANQFGGARSQPEFGQAMRAPILSGAGQAKAGVDAAYAAARDQQGDLPFQTQPLVNWLQDNYHRLGVDKDAAPIIAQLKRLGVISDDNMTNGSYNALPIPMREADTLRQILNDQYKTALKTDNYSGQNLLNSLRSVINQSQAEATSTAAPAAANGISNATDLAVRNNQQAAIPGQSQDLWKIAQQAHGAYKADYSNQPLISQMIKNRPGYSSPQIENSQMFKATVLNSTPEQLGHVIEIANRQDPSAQDLLRAQTTQYIKSRTFGGTGFDEAMNKEPLPGQLVAALKSIGQDKIDLIYGDQAPAINMLAKAIEDAYTMPRLGQQTSGTAERINILTRSLMSALSKGKRLLGPVGEAIDGLQAIGKQEAEKRANQMAVELAMKPIQTQANEISPYVTPDKVRNLLQLMTPAGAIVGASQNR